MSNFQQHSLEHGLGKRCVQTVLGRWCKLAILLQYLTNGSREVVLNDYNIANKPTLVVNNFVYVYILIKDLKNKPSAGGSHQ
jgi:hypothetical protein